MNGLKEGEEKNKVLINQENIDFYYISKAYETICEWIKSYEKNSGSFEKNFLKILKSFGMKSIHLSRAMLCLSD